MAGSFNRITIVGNVGRDPEGKTLPSGDLVTDFTVATTERRRGADGEGSEQTTWFRVSAFGRVGDIALQYLHRGSYVYIDGTLQQREYTDREGQTRQSLEVRARELRMLDRKEDAAPSLIGAGASVSSGTDDVPF